MKTYHLTYVRADETRAKAWILREEKTDTIILTEKTKAKLLLESRKYMYENEGSLIIHKMNGRIQEERTYPRSKDPRGSKG